MLILRVLVVSMTLVGCIVLMLLVLLMDVAVSVVLMLLVLLIFRMSMVLYMLVILMSVVLFVVLGCRCDGYGMDMVGVVRAIRDMWYRRCLHCGWLFGGAVCAVDVCWCCWHAWCCFRWWC